MSYLKRTRFRQTMKPRFFISYLSYSTVTPEVYSHFIPDTQEKVVFALDNISKKWLQVFLSTGICRFPQAGAPRQEYGFAVLTNRGRIHEKEYQKTPNAILQWLLVLILYTGICRFPQAGDPRQEYGKPYWRTEGNSRERIPKITECKIAFGVFWYSWRESNP